MSLSRNGVELLFRLLTDRYERSSVLITSNLAFADWAQVFQGETDDRGVAGPDDAPMSHRRDERGELPVPGVDEGQERPKDGMSPD